jgi:tetratricopeptide (TPR) repeat protein
MRNILIIIFVTAIISCNTKQEKTFTRGPYYSPNDTITDELSFYMDEKNKDLLVLNDNAVKILQNIHRVNDVKMKDSLLNIALNDVNTAIQRDSNFYNAYLNKAAVLRSLGKYEASIVSLQELLKRKKYPEAIFVLGITYEKLGNIELANEKYKEAFKEYDKRLNTPLAIVQDEINQQFLLIFIEGKEKVLKQINEKLKKDPNNTELLTNKSIIEEFDRKEFISSF